MSRWIRVQTAIFDHELFQAEPLTEREAWLWLIAHAAWKDTKHRIGMDLHDVQAGSLFVTLRQLQKEWRWKSDYRVRSFLKLLEKHEMIVQKTNAGKTQVTICNYSYYQEVERTENAAKTQEQRTKDTNTPVNTSSLRSDVSVKSVDQEFENEFWPSYPRKVGKGQALKAFRTARKQVGLEPILAGLSRYAAARNGENPEYTKHASTWLNGQCWLDEDQPKFSPHRSDPPRRRGETATDIWRDELIERGVLRNEPDGHQSNILDVGFGGGHFESNVHPLRVAFAGSK